MIFVTVGTTMPFDELIQAVDELAGKGALSEPVVCQIGTSGYVPKNCEYFRFKPGIDNYIEQSSLVIGHGGTGTVLSLLAARKKFIAVANPRGAEDHQTQFLNRLGQMVSILWTQNPNELPNLIKRAKCFEIKPITSMRLVDDLKAYLSQS